MGARQSKRSVDITTTPKKGDAEAAAAATGAVGEGGEGKLEKIADPDLKITTNGTALHNEIEFADKDENSKDETEEKEKADKTEVKENGVPEEPTNEPVENTNAEEQTNGEQEKVQESESKTDTKVEEESKKKKEKKKKWSFRSISFSKKDKSKPEKIKDEKNEDVKEVAEENTEAKTPESTKTEESAPKPDEADPKSETESSPAVIPEESAASVEEAKKDTETPQEPTKEESKPPAEEPVVQSKSANIDESAPAPAVEETKAEEPKVVEELKVNGDITPEKEAPADEPTKEVRTEEVPPPLPSSNPPSSVTVFAESTTADSALLSPSGQVTLEDSVVEVEKAESSDVVSPEVVPPPDLISESLKQAMVVSEDDSCPLPVKDVSAVEESCPLPNKESSDATEESDPPKEESVVEQSDSSRSTKETMPSKDMPSPVDESLNLSEYVLPTPPSEVESEPAKSESALNETVEEPTKTDIPPSEPHTNDIDNAPSTPPPTPAASSEKAPVDLPSIVSSELAAADSLPDISTESLPSLPEPVSESLPEPMSLPPVDSVPEPIAPSESDPVENHPPLTNGTTNGLNGTTKGVNGITNGLHSPSDDEPVVHDIPSGPAKQVLSEAIKECEITNTSEDKPSEVSEAVAVEE